MYNCSDTRRNPPAKPSSREGHLQAVAGGDAPQAGGAVVAGGERGAAVLRQRHLVQAAHVALQHSSAAAVRQVPHPARTTSTTFLPSTPLCALCPPTCIICPARGLLSCSAALTTSAAQLLWLSCKQHLAVWSWDAVTAVRPEGVILTSVTQPLWPSSVAVHCPVVRS